MKNTKEIVLNQVLMLREATITQLSEKLGISEISVRHHLLSLEAEGIITSSEERHGVGRPRFVYRLTEKGFQTAPTDYFKLVEQTLRTMKRFLGTETLLELFKQLGKDLAAGYSGSPISEDPDQILKELTKKLTQDGFIFSWTRSGESYTLTTHHCPFHYLGQNHPEVCTINHALLESLIEHPINHDTCILRGDQACTYSYEVDNGN